MATELGALTAVKVCPLLIILALVSLMYIFYEEIIFVNTTFIPRALRDNSTFLLKEGRPGSPCEFTNWTFTCTVKCPKLSFSNILSKSREQWEPICNSDQASISKRNTPATNPIPEYEFEDPCLLRTINKYCYTSKDDLVPNVLHFVFFGRHEFEFYHFLSIYSSIKYLNPCFVLIIGDSVPYGNLWELLLQLFPNILRVKRKPPTSIFKQTLNRTEHKADVTRLQLLLRYGGISIDTDTVILSDLKDLRKFPFTISKETEFNTCNAVIMAARNASFTQRWYRSYKNYFPQFWGYNSLVIPFNLAKYASDVNLLGTAFCDPLYSSAYMIFQRNYNWSENRGLHLYKRFNKTKHNFQDIRTLNTTVGSLSRHVLLGNKELCDS